MHHTNHHSDCQNHHCHCHQLIKALPITLSNNHRWRFEQVDVSTIMDSVQANERLFLVQVVSCCHNYTTDIIFLKATHGHVHSLTCKSIFYELPCWSSVWHLDQKKNLLAQQWVHVVPRNQYQIPAPSPDKVGKSLMVHGSCNQLV